MLRLFQNREIWILCKFFKFFGLDLEKKSTVRNGFIPYLAQMITSIRGCVVYNDLWPWPISSRSFGLRPWKSWPLCSIYGSWWIISYLVQMITSMRRCVACDDPWPWPISSRSLDLDSENRVHSVASTVLCELFLHYAQMITIIRGCVACYVFFGIWKLECLATMVVW